MSAGADHDRGGHGHSDHGAYGGHGHSIEQHDGASNPGKPLVFQGVFTTENAVIVEVPSHAYCDVKGKFIELAEAQKLIGIEKYWPNLMPVDKRVERIAGRRAMEDENNADMPGGFIPGSKGWTRLWRTYFQIGMRKNPLAFWEPLTVWGHSKAFLEVSCLTWCYSDVGDFQTFLVFKVLWMPTWAAATQRWTHDEKAFAAHKAKAQLLADQLYKWLLGYPPLEIARKNRQNHPALLAQEAAAQKTGVEVLLKDDPGKSEPLTGDYVNPAGGAATSGQPTESEGDAIDASQSDPDAGSEAPSGSSGANLMNIYDLPDPVSGMPGAGGSGDGALPKAPVGEQAEIEANLG